MSNQLRCLLPVNLADIQPDPYPTPRTNISGHVKFRWIGRDERGVVSRQHLANQTDNTIAVMIVQKVCERLLSDAESDVVSRNLASDFRHLQTDRADSPEALIFASSRFHASHNQDRGGGTTPSWTMRPSVSMMMRVSLMRPSTRRSMTMPQTLTCRPVAGTPRNAP